MKEPIEKEQLRRARGGGAGEELRRLLEDFGAKLAEAPEDQRQAIIDETIERIQLISGRDF